VYDELSGTDIGFQLLSNNLHFRRTRYK